MRYLTRAAALAFALTAGAVAVTAAPAQANHVCNLEVVSLTSWELNDNDGNDEIKIGLGDDIYGPWDMPDNWLRNASLGQPDEDFVGSIDVTLYEQDLTRQTIDTDTVTCNILGNLTLSLDGRGAIYDMVVNVTER